MTVRIEQRDIEPFCSGEGCPNDGVHKVFGKWYCQDCVTPLSSGPGKSFEAFMDGARELVEGKAKEKGYNQSGSERNDLIEFTNKFFPGHAGGEIVYKAIRYGRKGDKQDLLKVAAWAYLLWRYDQK